MKHLSALNCNYVVQLVGLQLEQAPAMIAMEIVPCGNLLDILKNSSIAVWQWLTAPFHVQVTHLFVLVSYTLQEEEAVFNETTTSGLTYVNKPVSEPQQSRVVLVHKTTYIMVTTLVIDCRPKVVMLMSNHYLLMYSREM